MWLLRLKLRWPDPFCVWSWFFSLSIIKMNFYRIQHFTHIKQERIVDCFQYYWISGHTQAQGIVSFIQFCLHFFIAWYNFWLVDLCRLISNSKNLQSCGDDTIDSIWLQNFGLSSRIIIFEQGWSWEELQQEWFSYSRCNV